MHMYQLDLVTLQSILCCAINLHHKFFCPKSTATPVNITYFVVNVCDTWLSIEELQRLWIDMTYNHKNLMIYMWPWPWPKVAALHAIQFHSMWCPSVPSYFKIYLTYTADCILTGTQLRQNNNNTKLLLKT